MKWTNGVPFNPRLLPLDVYIEPTNSGTDVPRGVKYSGGGDRGSRRGVMSQMTIRASREARLTTVVLVRSNFMA